MEANSQGGDINPPPFPVRTKCLFSADFWHACDNITVVYAPALQGINLITARY